MHRTHVEILIRRRGDPNILRQGAATTVRSTDARDGGADEVAFVLTQAALGSYPVQTRGAVSIPDPTPSIAPGAMTRHPASAPATGGAWIFPTQFERRFCDRTFASDLMRLGDRVRRTADAGLYAAADMPRKP